MRLVRRQPSGADCVTIGINNWFKTDFAMTDFANPSLAINRAITVARLQDKRKVQIIGKNEEPIIIGDSPIILPNDFELEQLGGIFKLRDNSEGNNPIGFRNADLINGGQNITLRNFVCDGNGANQIPGQNAGGVMLNFNGVENLWYDHVNIYNSVRFNSFIGTVNGAVLTGSISFTIDRRSVTGTNTLFMTELKPGQRIRSANGLLSPPILMINNDTSLTFVAPWPHLSEPESATNRIVNGVRVRVNNSRFGRTYENDTFGGGGWDNSEFSDDYFEDNQGYGFGATAMDHSVLINCMALYNINGFGLERVTNSTLTNCHSKGASSKGFNSINGCYNNTYNACRATLCADGFYDANTSPTKGQNGYNTYNACKADFNSHNGWSIAGSLRPRLLGCASANNSQSNPGAYYGYVFQDANGYNTISPEVRFCSGFDNQTSPTQTKDIHFAVGAHDAIVDFTGFNNISGTVAPAYSKNMKLLNGGKSISIVAGTSRATNNYETYILCNRDTFTHYLPRLDSIVDGHKIKYIYSGNGTPSWTFARSPSDSFGTLQDYSPITQNGSFWIEWCWDNTIKKWYITGSSKL